MHWELPKTTYIVGEEIQPVGFLRNYSDTVVSYSRKDFQDYALLNFTTVKPEKRHFRQVGFGSPKHLQPNDSSDYTTPCLLMYFGRGNYIGRFYLLPGSYAFCSPKFSSDTVFFVVEAPTTDVDIAAWKSMRRALDSSCTVLPSNDEEYNYFRTFVEEFPSSIYIPRALNFLVGVPPEEVAGLSQQERSSYANRLLIDYPTSPYATSVLYRVDPSLLTEREITQLDSSLTQILESRQPAVIKRQTRELLEDKIPLPEREGKR
jgi:hypothetical protein